MVQIHVQRTIAAPVEQVFDWMADPANLVTAPLVLKSAWAKDSAPVGPGAVRAVIGTGMWFREEISAYHRPNSYSYLIVRSVPPFDHDGGTLTFTPSGGGTHVDWMTSYTHPRYVGGKVMQAISRPLLTWSFNVILAACAKDLESRA